MRWNIGIVALALIICPGSVDAGTPEHTVVMKISGMPGKYMVQLDADSWAQLQALQTPGALSRSGSSNPLSTRGTNSLASRGGTSGAGSGTAGLQECTITKTIDQASPDLARQFASGTHLSSVTLELPHAGGDQRGHTSYELVNPVIESYQKGQTESYREGEDEGGVDGESQDKDHKNWIDIESWTIHFDTIRMIH